MPSRPVLPLLPRKTHQLPRHSPSRTSTLIHQFPRKTHQPHIEDSLSIVRLVASMHSRRRPRRQLHQFPRKIHSYVAFFVLCRCTTARSLHPLLPRLVSSQVLALRLVSALPLWLGNTVESLLRDARNFCAPPGSDQLPPPESCKPGNLSSFSIAPSILGSNVTASCIHYGAAPSLTFSESL